MKIFIIFTFLLSTSFISKAEDIAITAVKSNEQIILFLADKPLNAYQITYEQIELGDICGYMGCNWRKLVSIVVRSKKSNSPTKTILALVESSTNSNTNMPKVSFINFKNNVQNNLIFID
ncbi:MAG: hypothetical protein HRT54_02115 [Colwellia sp.]|nr:hypothetical protein [Colwellia sp.]